MRAVFRHELSSCFTGLAGFVFGAFLLLFAGIYTMVICLNNLVTNFEYVLGNMSFIYLVITPVLTMRVIAEERKQKTDQLLYSLPLSMTEVVLGKYAAMLVMLLIPSAIVACYPLVLSRFGDIYLPAALGAVVGFLLLGAALIAVGTFVSSLTESPVVAAGLCFAVLLVNYFLSSLSGYVSTTASGSLTILLITALLIAVVVQLMTKSFYATAITAVVLWGGCIGFYIVDSTKFEGLVPNIMEQLSLFDRFDNFINGVFDLRAAVFLLTVAGVFLFLTVQSMEKRRYS